MKRVTGMAKTEAETRLAALRAVRLVQRCEPVDDCLVVRLNGAQTDPRAPDFDKSAYDPAHRLVRGAHRDMTFELAPSAP
jgi:hypothetical protein